MKRLHQEQIDLLLTKRINTVNVDGTRLTRVLQHPDWENLMITKLESLNATQFCGEFECYLISNQLLATLIGFGILSRGFQCNNDKIVVLYIETDLNQPTNEPLNVLCIDTGPHAPPTRSSPLAPPPPPLPPWVSHRLFHLIYHPHSQPVCN